MTDMTITANTGIGARTGLLSAVRNHFAALGDGMRDGRAIETRYRALSQMASSELTALGLTRSDIARAALTGSSSKKSAA